MAVSSVSVRKAVKTLSEFMLYILITFHTRIILCPLTHRNGEHCQCFNCYARSRGGLSLVWWSRVWCPYFCEKFWGLAAQVGAWLLFQASRILGVDGVWCGEMGFDAHIFVKSFGVWQHEWARGSSVEQGYLSAAMLIRWSEVADADCGGPRCCLRHQLLKLMRC